MKELVYFSGKTTDKSIDELQKILSAAGVGLGGFECLLVNTEEVPKNGTDVIIYAAESDEPYVVVKSMGESKGMVLNLSMGAYVWPLEALRELGVCTELHIASPNWQEHDELCEALVKKNGRQEVSEHGFLVPENDSEFEVSGRISGGDTPSGMWMRIKVDIAKAQALALFSAWQAAGGEWIVTLKMEDGSDFEWIGDASDEGHAEGQAIAQATEEKGQQIHSVTSVRHI